MSEQATFHVAPTGERWSARAGQALLGHDVAYKRLGKVGHVVKAVVVDSGRALRLHVALARHLANPDRQGFRLYTAKPRKSKKAEEKAE